MDLIFSFIGPVITIVFLSIFITALKKNVAKGKADVKTIINELENFTKNEESAFKSNSTYVGSPNVKKDKSTAKNISSTFIEDRKNDWLAMQLREENRILRKGSFADLGASHSVACAAKSIKASHKNNCSDGVIDLGIPKRTN